jgi:OmpA-OmpF porin, OOP family
MKSKNGRFFAILATALTAIMLAGSAYALNVQTFRPKAAGNGTLHLWGTQTVERNNFSFGMLFNYSHDLLEYSNFGVAMSGGIVKHMDTIDFLFAYGLTDRITLHLDVPLHVWSQVQDIVGGTGENDKTGIGEIEFSALINLWKHSWDDKRKVGFAVAPFLTANTGRFVDYVREDGVSGGVKLVGDWWFSPRGYLTLNIGYRGRPEEQWGTLHVDDDLTWGLGYQRILSDKHKFTFFTEVFGATRFGDFGQDEQSSPIELIGGFKKGCPKHEGLNWVLGAGRGFLNAYGTPDIRVFGGFIYAPKAEVKEVPKAVEPVKEEPKAEAPAPEAVKEIAKSNISVNAMDASKQKIDANVSVKDLQGNVIQEGKGSNVTMDLIPGTYNVEVRADGYKTETLPLEVAEGQAVAKDVTLSPASVVVTKEKIEVKQIIYFDTAKASIKDVSKSILDEVADVLKSNPEIKKIRIEGHTDNMGPKEFNTKLSSDRAKSVSEYLSGKGVDPSRLESTGFGPDKPIADNATKDGRTKNRRVEFIIVE